jgi:hypothetical protein
MKFFPRSFFRRIAGPLAEDPARGPVDEARLFDGDEHLVAQHCQIDCEDSVGRRDGRGPPVSAGKAPGIRAKAGPPNVVRYLRE